MTNIVFSTKSDSFKLPAELKSAKWLEAIAQKEGREIEQLEVIFMTDEELLEINQAYLNHDYYTDIITFPYEYDPIVAELYISTERVKENAVIEKVTFEHELHRVMVHGLLHLCGYNDQNESEKAEIRAAENEALIIIDWII